MRTRLLIAALLLPLAFPALAQEEKPTGINIAPAAITISPKKPEPPAQSDTAEEAPAEKPAVRKEESRDSSTAIQSFTLGNGLEVIVIPNFRVPAVSHMLWYRIGAADDPPGKSGLAHFHEHMMFQGTIRYGAGEYADIIARNGGQQNAFTGYDATSYYVNIDKERLGLAMELEADRMRGLNPSDSGAEKEKSVILEERRVRVENNPDALIAEQMNAALFRHHPYHLPVIGWMHEMEGLTKADMLRFHRLWYHPNNAILILSGDITAREARTMAQRYYGEIPRGSVPKRNWNQEPPQNVERRITMRHPNVKQPTWTRQYMASSFGYGKKSDTLPLFLLSQMLGSGKTSELYKSLVVEQKLASAIDTDYGGFSLGPARFEISVIPEEGVELAELEQAIDKEIANVLQNGMKTDGMPRAKTLLKAESVFARDGLDSVARIMGWLRIVGLPTDYFTRWPELIDQVTIEQVNAAARDTFKPERSVTGILLPAAKPGEKQP